MSKIKVLIVDDHRIVREGLRLFLTDEARINIIGDVDSLKEMFQFLENQSVDIVLIDFKLRDGDGINGAQKIKDIYKNVKTVLITAYIEPEIIHSAINSSIDAIIFKSIEEDKLVETILKVYEGTYKVLDHLPKQYLEKPNDSIQWIKLSPKQREILDLLALGRTNIEIGVNLSIAEKTVRNYISIIFKKINVSNRTEAASYWIKSKMTYRDK